MGTFRIAVFLAALAVAVSSSAATIGGVISDSTGAALPSTRVTLKALATGEETVVETDAAGRYTFNVSGTGSYLVIVTRNGFSDAARTVVIEGPDHTVDLPLTLELGMMSDQVTVTSNRSDREVRQIPLHVETISRAGIEQANTLSTGDALTAAVSVQAVGSGPFLVRPRLRGLDSTRMLVLVDGERLNTARQATDRSMKDYGANSLDIVEVVSGAMRELKVKVPRTELNKLTNLDGLVGLLYEIKSGQTELAKQ